ncbi:MAG: hypothetical protein E6X17_01075 [Sporomusaceae bacterium]|nr:hypothetical protein [Sporomusaceae bacterium]
MTNEEFQQLMLEEIRSIRKDMATKEEIAKLATKEEIAKLDAKVEQYGQIQQDDVKGLLELMDKKLDQLSANQITQGESINILALRQLQIESQFAALQKVK